MKVVLENIASVSEASIELSNLTVLSGKNDTGKTTIAKVIYALGQATSSFKHDYQLRKEFQVQRLHEELYMKLTRYIYTDTSIFASKEKSIDISSYISSKSSLEKSFLSSLNKLRRGGASFSTKNLIEVEKIVERLLVSTALSESIKNDLHNLIEKIKEKTEELKNNLPTSIFIYDALKSEFSDEIVKAGCEEARLTFFDGGHKVFQLSFNNNNILEFSGDDLLRIADSTLIEGPAIFQIATLLGRQSFINVLSQGRMNKAEDLPYHIIDLCFKLNGTRDTLESMIGDPIFDDYDWDLSEFYEGSISYEESAELFKLSKNGNAYHGNNISSGMKAVAVLDLLIKGNYITKNTLLILDEPETNLHPTWQKNYAKAIVKLAAKGARVLVNTHSPYMLEALKIYSDKEDFKPSESKFYYSSKNNDEKVSFVDTEGDISVIISALSAPLYDLIEEAEGDIDDF